MRWALFLSSVPGQLERCLTRLLVLVSFQSHVLSPARSDLFKPFTVLGTFAVPVFRWFANVAPCLCGCRCVRFRRAVCGGVRWLRFLRKGTPHRRGSVQRIAIDALGLAPCLPAGVAHCALSRSQQSQAVCEEGR